MFPKMEIGGKILDETWVHIRFGTSCLQHVKILSSAHLQRRGLGQDAENWQDLWDMLVSSIQHETSDCRRGTFYFDINLKFCWLRFWSNHRGIKIQGLQVDVRVPFQSPRLVRHNNLNWCPKLVRTIQSCYWTSNTRYTCLHWKQKQLNESNNCSTRYSSMQILPKHIHCLMLTLPWLLHHPRKWLQMLSRTPGTPRRCKFLLSNCLQCIKPSTLSINQIKQKLVKKLKISFTPDK